MTEERRAGMDPAELWRQWYETGTKMWSELTRGAQESYVDPYGLYRQWFETMEDMRDSMMGAAAAAAGDGGEGSDQTSPLEPRELWRKWFDATAESWQKASGVGTEMMGMAPRWTQMMEQARDNLMSVESFPKDPLEFSVQWYNATSGPFSQFVQDIIEREELLEASSQYMQNYAKLYKIFRQNSEEYLRSLSVPVRSDIARVASLVVALEDKVDRIEEAFEDFEYGYAEPATAESVSALEARMERIEDKLDTGAEAGATAESVNNLGRRLDQVEGKLDQLLAAVEALQGAQGTPSGNTATGEASSATQDGSGAGEQQEIRATEAARRKAEELGVDLAEVQGTGADGQITIGDVRREGES